MTSERRSRELRRSMSRQGSCWDNASLGQMKNELAGRNARVDIFHGAEGFC